MVPGPWIAAFAAMTRKMQLVELSSEVSGHPVSSDQKKRTGHWKLKIGN
jgi:hypothetical protein